MNVELKRSLGPVSAVMITVGSVIGSGIFLKPLVIAQSLSDPLWIHAAWIGIGLVCLCGAFAYAELGAMLPEAGGQYAFLREGWGRLVAFLFGWCYFLVINTGTMSALAVAFAATLARLVPIGEGLQLAVAAAMILAIALVNHFGARSGAVLQNLSTFAKIGSLLLVVVAGSLVGRVPAEVPAVDDRGLSAAGLVTVAVAIFWAYEGWHQLPFSAAELKRPQRDLPLGLILGLGILIAIYVVVNATYLHLVPLGEMRGLGTDIEVPTLAIERIFGGTGASLLAVMICLSVFGAANPNMLSSSRAFYAMAKDGLALPALTRVHRVYRTPTVSIWLQAIWAIVLIFVLKGFHDLTEFVVFAALIFYGLAVAAVYVLRVRRPDRLRPHRCVGYPWTPAVFLLAVVFVDWQMLMDPVKRTNALIGVGILAAGLPVYGLARRWGRAG